MSENLGLVRPDQRADLTEDQERTLAELRQLLVYVVAATYELEALGTAPWDSLGRRLGAMTEWVRNQAREERRLRAEREALSE